MDKKITKDQVIRLNKVYHETMFCMDYMFRSEKENFKRYTTLELKLISIISENPNIPLKSIRDKLNISASSLSTLINTLEKKGVIQRLINKNDKRSYSLQLSDLGAQIKSDYNKFEDMFYNEMLKALDNYEERETLIKLLGKITEHLRKL